MSETTESVYNEGRRLWNAQADEFNQWPALGQDEKDEQITKVHRSRQDRLMDKRQLRSLRPDVFWDSNNEVIQKLQSKDGPELADLEQEELWHLIKELDRRFIQLWDKVAFEREHKLTDYSSVANYLKKD